MGKIVFLKKACITVMKDRIANAIADLLLRAETDLPQDVEKALREAMEKEEGIARATLSNIIKNVELARKYKKPMCQDTGTPTFFVKMGVNFPYRDIIKDAIEEGVRIATDRIPLRPNAVDVITGKNSGDNTGIHIPYINWEIVSGNECEITAMPKGGGSENASALKMLKPGEGLKGVKKFVLEQVAHIGGEACSPNVVGVGIGGGGDISMKLAKIALLRKIGERNPDPEIAKMEIDFLNAINSLGIGPMGLGGKTTCLDVHIEVAHRHPASFPVGIAMQCWANRRKKIKIDGGGNIWNID